MVMVSSPTRISLTSSRTIFWRSMTLRLSAALRKRVRNAVRVSAKRRNATSDGHCALPLGKLKLAATKLLEVPEGTVEQALSQMLTSGSLLLEEIDGEPLIFLPHLRKAEEGIALRIKRLAGGAATYPQIDFEKAVAWCEGRTGKTLAPSQREALKTILANRTVVITGGPGVGKTTLVNSILLILMAKGVKCLLCAPTGRAAKRLAETTGMEAKTIHRLLEINPATGRFTKDESSPLACDPFFPGSLPGCAQPPDSHRLWSCDRPRPALPTRCPRTSRL